MKTTLTNGETVDAIAPTIISASRSTDIPAFYADWFFHRLAVGYSAWTNPFNQVQSYVSYAQTRFIVFWSKNPKPLLPHLDTLKKRGIHCYIQYTLNDYVKDGLENGVPSVEERIATFKKLVDTLGKGSVIWRFDPMILTDTITIDDLLKKVEYIGDQLKGYTEKLVFSYADINSYKKVANNLRKNNIHYIDWDEASMIQFAQKLSDLNQKWNYQLATCGEAIDMTQFGITHNKCIDDDLMIKLAHHDAELMKFLGVEIVAQQNDLFGSTTIPDAALMITPNQYAIKKRNKKDKGQRQFCGCIISKDIGEYNTCPHQCEYCYANTSKERAAGNWAAHLADGTGETIRGRY